MGALDMRTALVGMVAVFTVCAAIIGALWYQSRERFNGMQWVAAGLATSTLGVSLLSLRELIPDLLSLSLASILLLGGNLLVLIGMEHLVDRVRPKHMEMILLFAYGAYSVYFAFDPVDQTFRVFVNALVLSVISGESAWLMLAGVERSMRRLTRDVGLAFTFLTTIHLARAAAIVTLGAGPTFMHSNSPDVLMIVLHSAAVVAVTFSLALLLYGLIGQKLRTQERILASAFRASPFAMVLSRLADGTIFEANEAFCELTGYSRDEVIGRSSRELGIWRRWEDRDALTVDLRAKEGVDRREMELRSRTGEQVIGMISAEALCSDGEEYMVTSIVDISERKRMEDEVRELAIRDQLTGLYNRRGFFTVVGHMAREAERFGVRLRVVFLDCDRLKVLNDTRGHDEGDRALVNAAVLLRETFRGSDVIARMGGDEFAVCFSEQDDAMADAVLARLGAAVRAGRDAAGDEPWVDLSWGWAVYDPTADDTIDDALARADVRMYEHKRRSSHAR